MLMPDAECLCIADRHLEIIRSQRISNKIIHYFGMYKSIFDILLLTPEILCFIRVIFRRHLAESARSGSAC